MATYPCSECLKKQQKIDSLMEENQRLKQKLKYQQRKEKEGVFGSSTPSSKLPVKANTTNSETGKPKGAQLGHKGADRKMFQESEAERVVSVEVQVGSTCPDCGRPLEEKGMQERLVIESQPLKAKRVLFRLPKKYGPHCQKVFQAHAPEVLPKSLYGNQLITTAAVMHYLHGIPMGRVCEQTEIGPGSLVEIFHRLAKLFEKVPAQLIEQYRQAPVKHADETGWRTERQNGYTLCHRKAEYLSISQIKIGGGGPGGIRRKAPSGGSGGRSLCGIQQGTVCHSILLCAPFAGGRRPGKGVPDSGEVQGFVHTLIPLRSLAMGLRSQPLSRAKFKAKATEVKSQIVAAVESPAQHLGIRRIQDIFRENHARMYH